MRTEDLIADLASRATPVRPLLPPAIRFAGWSLLALGSGLAGLIAFGPRANLAESINQPLFIATAALSLVAAVLSGIAALTLAVPGAERSSIVRVSALALVGAWGAVLVSGLIHEGGGFPADPHWPVCAIRIMAVGAIPGWMLVRLIRRAAPLQPAMTGALAAIAVTAAAAVAIQFVCPFDAPAHVLRGHFAPVVILVAVSAWIAQSGTFAPRANG